MKAYSWAVLGLGLCTVGAVGVAGGQTPPAAVELKENYPNPCNPATTIPFALSAELFASGRRPKVSLRIYNVLAQVVAVPVLQGTGEPLENLELKCTNRSRCAYSAYWDGTIRRTGEQAASGVYIYQLAVDGRRYTKKMMVMR